MLPERMMLMKRKGRRLLPLLLAACLLWAGMGGEAGASYYITGEGETLSGVAGRCGCEAELLAAVNGLEPDTELAAGMLLTLADGPTLEHRVQPGDTVCGLARDCGCSPRTVAALNRLEPPYLIYTGDILLLPLGEERACIAPTEEEAADLPPEQNEAWPALAGAVGFIWPVSGEITSPFGWREEGFHSGLDIGVSLGTPVLAAAAGQVREAGWLSDGYGWGVIVDHGGGLSTLYAHGSEVWAGTGDWVEQGQCLALSGSSGNSTGPHLHFEVRREDECADPLDYLP